MHDGVIFGTDDAEPVLGATVPEFAGIEINLRGQRLNRLPAPRRK